MDPSVGMLSPAADTNLTDDSVLLASMEKLAATLCSINEIEEPESTIIMFFPSGTSLGHFPNISL